MLHELMAQALRDDEPMPELLRQYHVHKHELLALGERPDYALDYVLPKGAGGDKAMAKELGFWLVGRRLERTDCSTWEACRIAADYLTAHGLRVDWRTILRHWKKRSAEIATRVK